MNIDGDTKRFLARRLKWVGLYLATSLILVVILPAPYDLISVFGLFILVNFLRVKGVILKGHRGKGGIKDLFGSLFPSLSGNDRSRPLKYYCMSCGKEHRQITCPSCGSKMKGVR
jgi:hypothetical protein